VTLPAAALALAVALAGSAGAARPSVRVLRLVDHSRRAHFANGTTAPRVLVTYVRVPPSGRPPYPLVVFAHGFSLTPAPYARLLDAWADAGYVVAAPLFPVEGANAPGGPSESDLVNEPRDLGFVARRLTSRTSPLHGLVDPARVAFAGHSDGAEAALAAAYDRRYRQPRVDAAVVLSGAAFPGFTRPRPGSPPLLAVQGTADPINPPGATSAYYRLMRRPKFLLWLVGASHLPPYSTRDRWFPAVVRTTTAFLGHYLRGRPLAPLVRGGSQAGVTRLVAEP
jgi:poly(3-hydroxybutyrate) depolymerase